MWPRLGGFVQILGPNLGTFHRRLNNKHISRKLNKYAFANDSGTGLGFVKNSPKKYAKPFLSKSTLHLNSGKSSPNVLATFFNLKKSAQRKQLPNGRKFSQSGHPECNLHNKCLFQTV
jgi:hypothetical protein